jgi:hypothetical protein
MARVLGNSGTRGDLNSVTRGYRNRDHSGPQAKPAFRDLQAHWYAKLKAEGFRDIEGMRDTNKLNWSTLPGDRFVFRGRERTPENKGRMAPADSPDASDVDWSLEVNARIFGGELATSDLPEAQAWRALSAAAHELPEGWRGAPLPEGWSRGAAGGLLPKNHPGGRGFIIDVCQTGCIALHLLQRHKLTRGWARKLWRDFVAQAQMPEAQRLLVKGHVRESDDVPMTADHSRTMLGAKRGKRGE